MIFSVEQVKALSYAIEAIETIEALNKREIDKVVPFPDTINYKKDRSFEYILFPSPVIEFKNMCPADTTTTTICSTEIKQFRFNDTIVYVALTHRNVYNNYLGFQKISVLYFGY